MATSRPGVAVVALLAAGIAYAAFAHGAVPLGDESRLQVALALALTLGGAVWLFHGALPLGAPRLAWAGIALLVGFAAWTGITLGWSETPDRTWVELNRVIAYVLVVLLGVAAACWWPRAIEGLAIAYLAVAVAVSLYALGGKFAPGVHVAGLFDLDHTGTLARLRAPLDYWNALSLFSVMAVPIGVRLAIDTARSRRTRLLALLSLELLLVTAVLTYSRGGVIALVVACGITIVLAGAALRTVGCLALAVLAAAPPTVLALTNDDLTANFAKLSERQGAGALFGLLLALSLAGLWFAGRGLIRLEERVTVSAARSRQIAVGVLVATGVALLAGVGAVGASDRGLTGTVSHEWKSFRSPKANRPTDPARLVSTSSGNRWTWWREAAGIWSDRPLRGWGAGSFGTVHQRYRERYINVQQPHSMPLQFLAETGLVGALLALAALVLLSVAATLSVRRLPPGSTRGIAAALAGASIAWVVHGLADWDWDLPGVTLPALAFFGVLVGGRGRNQASTAAWTEPGRVVALVTVTVLMSAVAISAALPGWADSKTSRALKLGNDSTPGQLRTAAAKADLASRLDPLAIRPLLAAASIAERRGQPLEARRYLLRALSRQPAAAIVWVEIARLEFPRRNLDAVQAALIEALRRDPRNPAALGMAASVNAFLASPSASATATGTPLPTFVPVQPRSFAQVVGGPAAQAAQQRQQAGAPGRP
jgi:O-antigen ligase/polysaccharide polymerase Wzy-like membrane protein